MKSFFNIGCGHVGGFVNVMIYDWQKKFLPGEKISIRIKSQVKLDRVAYCWNDGKETEVFSFLKKHYWFRITMPKAEIALLTVITEGKFAGKPVVDRHEININGNI